MKVRKHLAGGVGHSGRWIVGMTSLAVVLCLTAGCLHRHSITPSDPQSAPGFVPPPPPALVLPPPITNLPPLAPLPPVTNPPPEQLQPPVPPAAGTTTGAVTAPGQQPVPILDLEKQLLDFQRQLSQTTKEQSDYLTAQADKHRAMLEFYYTLTLGFLALCGAILTFFFVKSLREAKAIINENVETIKNEAKTAFDQKIAASLQGFNDSLNSNKALAEAAVKKLQQDYTHDRRTVIWLASVIARAYVVLSHPPITNPDEKTPFNSERKAVIAELKSVQQKGSATNRTVAIALGRLYRLAGQYEAAYQELENVAQHLSAQDPDSTQDMADILFNQACYLSLQAGVVKEEGERETLRQRAWETLKKSISFRPENREDAKTDSDLIPLFDAKRHPQDL